MIGNHRSGSALHEQAGEVLTESAWGSAPERGNGFLWYFDHRAFTCSAKFCR